MKINLRKAAVVQQQIQEEIKRIGSEKTAITVSLYDTDVESKLNTQFNKYIVTNQRVSRLMDANRFLRATVARKNAEVGIMDYLAEDAMLSAFETRLRGMAELTPRISEEAQKREIESRISTIASERNIYGRNEHNIEVNVVTEQFVNDANAELEQVRRRRRKIKDEMVSVNVRTEIDIPEQVALVLTELGLD